MEDRQLRIECARIGGNASQANALYEFIKESESKKKPALAKSKKAR